ncbi:hypothetical protein SAMN05444149_10883 [Pseudosulfitobacter pseudonitzschiae]|nr:hypothetical protein SAMN05444149_10883 [Pseudosulfitobacter pseudonitzschiae]
MMEMRGQVDDDPRAPSGASCDLVGVVDALSTGKREGEINALCDRLELFCGLRKSERGDPGRGV